MKTLLIAILLLSNLNANNDTTNGMHLLEKGISAYDLENYRDAAWYFDSACKQNNGLACYKLAIMQKRGKGIDANFNLAVSNLEKACFNGHASACGTVGQVYLYPVRKGDEPNFIKASKLYLNGCKLGDARSCQRFSLMNIAGLGVARNIKKGLRILENLCKDEKGYCSKLGYTNLTGELIPEKHINSMNSKCMKGDETACLIYSKLKTLPKIKTNIHLAIEYYEQTCAIKDNFHGYECGKIGDIYSDTKLGIKDMEKAALYYKKCYDNSHLTSTVSDDCLRKYNNIKGGS